MNIRSRVSHMVTDEVHLERFKLHIKGFRI